MGLAILEGYQSDSLLTAVCFYKVERIFDTEWLEHNTIVSCKKTPSIKTTDTCYVFIRVRQHDLDARVFL